MDMTHTWKLMKEKVDMEVRASQKISPFKPTMYVFICNVEI
jgi:hypothetical protein